MRSEIEQRFGENLERVRRLVETYGQLAGAASGRRTVAHTDVLRAAVVLLHASMEDLLRSVSRWKLPMVADPSAFKDMPFPDGTATKHTLVDLARYRNHSVDELFEDAIDQHLARATYNNPPEVGEALRRIGIPPAPILAKFGPKIAAITGRRHLIAHGLDANPRAGSGHHAAHSLPVATVRGWTRAVQGFGAAVLDQC